ncbi:MAG: diguanylate cyclase [Leptothrix ochracea]|uniref:sensor domain-containing diguanylate cyclase n=1 Tax=Leptothrix ochracea TaxID=735331 RepID=UPI0034E2AEC1
MSLRSQSVSAAMPGPPHPLGQHRYLIVLLAISLPFMALLVLNLHAAQTHARSIAINRAENLSLVIEHRLSLHFRAAEHVLKLLTQQVPTAAMAQGQMPKKYRATLEAWLQSHSYALIPHSTLSYFDARGRRLYASEPTADENIADEAYFQQLKQHPQDILVDATKTQVHHTGQGSLVIALAVHDEQQRFLGMATVATDISALLHEFQDLHLGPDSVVTLRRIDDGSLVIRSLGTLVTDAFPERRMVIPQAIQQGTPQGHLEIVSPADGITRMYGYRVIDHSPLYVAVGLAEKDHIEEGSRLGRASGALGAIFLLILATALLLMNRAASARQRSEEQLRASERRFRHLIDDHRAVILQINPDTGRIVDANEAAADFYGWSREELRDLSISDINNLPPAEIRQALKQSKHGSCTHFVFPHRLRSGEVRTVDVHATPIDIDGHIILVAIIFDITERLRNEAALTQLMQEQKAILEGRLIGIAKLHQRHILWSNQAMADMFGYTPEEMVGQAARTFYVEEADFIAFGQKAYPAIQDGSCYRETLQLQRSNGSTGWFDINIAPLFPGSDVAIMALVDVTPRMLAQLALQESEERLRTLADYTYDMETWIGPDGKLIYISPACERVSGYTPSDYMADPSLLDRIVLDEDRERVTAACRLGPEDAPHDMSFRIRCKNGDLRWIARGIRPVHASDGRPLGLRANDRDITQLKHAEQLAQSLAHADALTGLPNRRMLMEHLTQNLLRAQRFHRPLGLIFIDLNDFKRVNDQWGHDTGDELLRQVAQRLCQCVRASDTVARLGGDEFVILLTELSHADDATRVADKILQAFVEPVRLGEHALIVTMSMGITLPDTKHRQDPREVMAQADQAMYRVKRSGQNGWVLFREPT